MKKLRNIKFFTNKQIKKSQKEQGMLDRYRRAGEKGAKLPYSKKQQILSDQLKQYINFMYKVENMEKSQSRLNWTNQQQAYLKQLREINEIGSWTIIAKQLNQVFQDKNRSGKQCRERYMNYVRFSGQKESSYGWTRSEDEMLFGYFFKYGRKWVEICKEMPGKSENSLKNRFYGAIRKISRRITRAFKQKKIKQKKVLKQDAYIKILQNLIGQEASPSHGLTEDDVKKLQNDIISIAIIAEEELVLEQIIRTGNRIHEVNFLIKAKGEEQLQAEDAEVSHSMIMNKQEQEQKGQNQKTSQEQEIKIYIKQANTLNKGFSYDIKAQNQKQEEKYLSLLGFDCSSFNNSVSQDLERQASQILNFQCSSNQFELF